MSKQDTQKLVLGLLAGAVVSGASFFLLGAIDHASHDDIEHVRHELEGYVQNNAPYVKDRGTIFTRLDSIDRQLGEIKELLKAR